MFKTLIQALYVLFEEIYEKDWKTMHLSEKKAHLTTVFEKEHKAENKNYYFIQLELMKDGNIEEFDLKMIIDFMQHLLKKHPDELYKNDVHNLITIAKRERDYMAHLSSNDITKGNIEKEFENIERALAQYIRQQTAGPKTQSSSIDFERLLDEAKAIRSLPNFKFVRKVCSTL